ncbi:MAG: cation diffusion facilitator family transporter [Clostridiaceae bacterium]|nr:cation diffusion facilitator family transporter [Clostridiaceae bacterium]MDO4495650.1 cation diffusion facilitator family transporter [Clostridiaceae bacterium]
MTQLLIKLFVKDYQNTESEAVRVRYGTLSGLVGIAINIILSVSKMIFGAITKSISIIADGANNTFDAISSIINLVGFKISGKPADDEHPFGHGRIEYVSALTLSFFILIMGVELIKTSIDKFRNPETVIFSVPAAIVLIISILAKLWLAIFNRNVGKRINSVAVNAIVTDSLGDIAATTCSLIALISSKFTDLPIDAVMGIVVALVIIYAGIDIIKGTIGPLLGEPPEKEIVDRLEKLVMSYDGVVGIHDLVLHCYGHSKIYGSLHAEVPADIDILHSHDTIDLIERQVKEQLGIEISIHMDPIINDERTHELKSEVNRIVKEICPEASIHDFRIVDGPTHTNLIFDALLPRKSPLTEQEFNDLITSKIKELDKKYFTVINIDRSFTA